MSRFISRYNDQFRNESGMITLISLGLIALLFVSIFSLMQIFSRFDIDKSTRQICQKELLHLQKNVAEDLLRLLKLNAPIRSVKKSKAIAKAMIAAGLATTNSALIAVGGQILATNLKTEKVLATAQNYFLISANRKMQLGPIAISEEIKKELRIRKLRLDRSGKDDFITRLQPLQITTKNSLLAVREIRSDEGPPEYELQDQFMQKQALHISWKYLHEIGTGGSKIWKKIKLTKQNGCAVSLEQKQDLFRPVLIGDRPLSKQFF